MKDLRIGDKLYELSYVGCHERYMDAYTIKRVNRDTYSLKGYAWMIKKDEVGTRYFPSKEAAIKNTIRLTGQDLIEPMKEIKSLQNWLKRVKKK